MCDLFEYSVVQHKTTLWTLILCLLTMLLFGIWQFLQIFRELSQQLTLLEVIEFMGMEFLGYLICLAIAVAFLILLNCRKSGFCCCDSFICVLVFVILEMICYLGLIVFFTMELAKNVRPVVIPYSQLIWSDTADPLEIQFRYRAQPLSYDFFRLLILSIEQFLLVINMLLLIVRMGWYLVCCSPCVGTRRFDDMCKDTAYFCREDSLTSKPRSQGYLRLSDEDTSILVIGQPRKLRES